MNAVQAGTSGAEKSKSIRNVNRPESLDSKPESAERSADKLDRINKQANIAAVRSRLNRNNVTKNKSNAERDTLEIDEYMKMISRLENKLKLEQLEDTDLEKLIKALEERLLSLNDQQKSRLKSMRFFKENNIQNINEMNKKLESMFKDTNDREKVFEFLKNPEFLALLLDKASMPKTYTVVNNLKPVDNKIV